MANPTTNFGWQMPTSTDLVTDLPADFEVFGQAVDTALAELKGGTTGQVLSKTSNTNMDFTWVTTDDANAIQNAIVDAKGDLIAASANDTPARLAVGNNGETLVADSSTSTGLRYTGLFGANKNKIINGDFGIWQRGTTVTPASGTFGYGADRWRTYSFAATSSTLSQQSFTPGTAPVAGYEGTFFARFASTNTATYASQPIEDVRTFAGQTITVSFYAKSASAQTLSSVKVDQNFGSGGSSTVTTNGTPPAITTSWARYSVTIAVPSISGKTIGTSSNLDLVISGAINNNLDLWGVQAEAGSVATPFQTATGTLQGELAACQRYYFRASGTSNSDNYGTMSGFGLATGTSNVQLAYQLPVTMRTGATSIDYANLSIYGGGTGGAGFGTVSAASLTRCTPNFAEVILTTGTVTTGAVYRLQSNNSSGAFFGLSAEL
jgi:hypothetical protein